LELESPPVFEGSPVSMVAPFSLPFVFWSPVFVSVSIGFCESVVVWFGSPELKKRKNMIRGATKGCELRDQYQCTCNIGMGGLVSQQTRLKRDDVKGLSNDFVEVGAMDSRR